MIRDRRLCRAARGLACWSQLDLAEHSNVSLSTVRAFESGEYVHPNHIAAMTAALERQGVVFSSDGGEGNPSISLPIPGTGLYQIVLRQRKGGAC